jgi:hypothetical protein
MGTKRIRGPLHCFGNRPGIQIVALVGLQVRLHVLRRHQAHLVPLFPQGAPQKVRTTAGLHADQLHLQVRSERQQLSARTSLAKYDIPGGIQSDQMKDSLAQIDAQHV